MDKPNVIFLDIDGVLNSRGWNSIKHEIKDNQRWFDPKAVKRLNKIIKATDAKIIISSSWRSDGITSLRELFAKVGIEGEVIDITPHDTQYGYRGIEINTILHLYNYPGDLIWDKKEESCIIDKSKSKIKNYVIIDDCDDMLYRQRNHFVKTKYNTGLLDEHVRKAIKILKKEFKYGEE